MIRMIRSRIYLINTYKTKNVYNKTIYLVLKIILRAFKKKNVVMTVMSALNWMLKVFFLFFGAFKSILYLIYIYFWIFFFLITLHYTNQSTLIFVIKIWAFIFLKQKCGPCIYYNLIPINYQWFKVLFII
jgi:hypothetical protein